MYPKSKSNIILENSFGNDKLYIVSAINTSNEYKVKNLNIILEKYYCRCSYSHQLSSLLL